MIFQKKIIVQKTNPLFKLIKKEIISKNYIKNLQLN